MTFRVHEQPLETVTTFKLLVRLITMMDDNWPAVIVNQNKSWKKWYLLYMILGKEGADTRTSGHLYLSVVQAVLLFDAETWVATPRILRLLGSFHNRVEIIMADI